jgi:acetyltransferase
VLAIFRRAAGEGRRMLTEPEAKAVIAAYGIPVPETVVARSPDEAEEAAARLLAASEKVVVKLLSRAITHKSDIGGVVLGIDAPQAARAAAEAILRRVAEKAPGAGIDGFAVQPMVVRNRAQELILGMSRDPVFGPAVLFGAGGVAVEVMDDTAIALPPLDDVLAGDLIDRTRIGRLLAGFRDRAPADRAAIQAALGGLSQMIVDFPCIAAMDINPLLADADGVVALDARIEIEPGRVEESGPNQDLAIRPYPAGWSTEFDAKGQKYVIRPIRPADVDLYPGFLAKVSRNDIRLRFLAPRLSFPDEMLRRLTQLDYDRDMAFVAIAEPSGELAGIGRLSSDPDRIAAEYGLIVRTDLQGQGLGRALLSRIVDFARAEGIGRVEGMVLGENDTMLSICRQLGFGVRYLPDDPGLVRVSLDLR